MRYLFVLITLFPLFFSSCDNELDPNAKWKDISIVYGLLDVNDSIQYIKINKAYLNENSDALEVANIPDSIFYDTSKISVKIEQIRNGFKIGETRLYADTLNNKKEGDFANPVNILYRNKTNFPLNTRDFYKLVITKKNGSQVTSTTRVVDNADPIYPETNGQLLFGEYRRYEFRWLPGNNAYFYDLSLKIRISEKNTSTGETKIREAIWKVFSLERTKADGREMTKTINSSEFYVFLANQMEPLPNTERRILKLTLIYASGEEEIYNYIRVNKPAIGLVQKVPEYSNVENGYGIYSSRATTSIPVNLSDVSIDSLLRGKYTRPLNFRR